MLPPVALLAKVQDLIKRKKYFTVRAPRESGKTTSMTAIADIVNQDGDCYAIYCSLDPLVSIMNTKKAMKAIIPIIYDSLYYSDIKALKGARDASFWSKLNTRSKFKGTPVTGILNALSAFLDKDLVIFFDYPLFIDITHITSLLSQLRHGFTTRQKISFPSSIALIGSTNVLDLKSGLSSSPENLESSSCFNLTTETLTLANFSQDDIKSLYSQHTQATGQAFDSSAIQRAWYWTEGQPWFVNALACEVVEKILGYDYGISITQVHIDRAVSNLIAQGHNNIATLKFYLQNEPPIKMFIRSMLPGFDKSIPLPIPRDELYRLDHTLQWFLDLGLLKKNGEFSLANRFYSSAILRLFSRSVQNRLPKELSGQWVDGRAIDMTGLLQEFQLFFSLNSQNYILTFPELGTHSVLSAFLHKAIGDGASIVNEIENCRDYTHIAVHHAGRGYAIELKIKENQGNQAESFERLVKNMDTYLSKEAWLVVFDLKADKSKRKELTWETKTMPTGHTIHIVEC
jgi:hypothetical protein